jgi:hypothetical protein
MNPKQQVEKLIDILSDKTLSFGLFLTIGGKQRRIIDASGASYMTDNEWFNNFDLKRGYKEIEVLGNKIKKEIKILGHDIFLGRVLKIMNNIGARDFPNDTENTMKLVGLWEKCGIDKSLQTQIQESGWFKRCLKCGSHNPSKGGCSFGSDCESSSEQLKNPETRNLINFLIEKFNV